MPHFEVTLYFWAITGTVNCDLAYHGPFIVSTLFSPWGYVTWGVTLAAIWSAGYRAGLPTGMRNTRYRHVLPAFW
jgi:hypothetical protein